MLQPHLSRREGDVLGLSRIERQRLAGGDIAEAAGARADAAKDHEGRVLLAPALADVRTARLFADRVQLQIADQLFRLVVAEAGGRLHPDPIRLAWRRIIGPPLFFGVAGAVWVASLAQINQRWHDSNMSLRGLSRNVSRANLPCMANDLMVASLVRPQSGR